MNLRYIGLSVLVFHLVLSQENYGTTGLASFLNRGFSAKWIGMGGAPIALVDDASSTFWNPAGLVNGKRFQITSSWINAMQFSGINFVQAAISYSHPKSIKSRLNWGMGALLVGVNVGNIEMYDDKASYLGEDNYDEYVGLIGLSLSYSGIKIGFSHLNYYMSNLGIDNYNILTPKKDLITLGIQYYIVKGVNVGIVIRNKAELLPGEFLPSQEKIGIGYSGDRIKFEVDYHQKQGNKALSTGGELFRLKSIPVTIRFGISGIGFNTSGDNEYLKYNRKISFGVGYLFKRKDGKNIEISAALLQHSYPSLLNPFNRNFVLSVSLD